MIVGIPLGQALSRPNTRPLIIEELSWNERQLSRFSLSSFSL